MAVRPGVPNWPGAGRLLSLVVFALAAVGLGACAENVVVAYTPTSSLTASGSLTVAAFAYLPAVQGEVQPNQLKNTAPRGIKLDQHVDAYFRDGVFKELRFVGIKVDGANLVLSGEIKQFLVEDLGYDIDWTVETHYVLKDAGGAVVYDAVKLTKNRTDKFVDTPTAINHQIRDNVEALLNDAAFTKAIQ